MCGIAFLVDPTQSTPELQARGQAALARLLHRGPDNLGVRAGMDWVAVHTRLAIVDLVGGAQPKQDDTRRYTLVFNGEIYNFRALRQALEGRWRFRDASDTEVLLAGLVLDGTGFIDRLDGMWAFALHDSADGSVLLSRDRFGKKPLYVRTWAGGIACASELPALRALLPGQAWDEDRDGLADFFRYGYALPGRTCIANVVEVLPGHWWRWSPGQDVEQQRYWWPLTEPFEGSRGDAAEAIGAALRSAVRSRQLAADVDVGAFLSGGVDSNVVCALAQAGRATPLETFTAGFGEASFDERPYAARAARAIGTRHHALDIDDRQARGFATSMPARLGQPFGDSSFLPTALLAQFAAESVKVVLTGDGADEVFGGYARYAGRLLAQRYNRLPAALRGLAARGVRAFPEPVTHHSGSLLKKAHLFLELARQPAGQYVAPVVSRPALVASMAPALVTAGHRLPEAPWPCDLDEVRAMMRMDWLVYLPQDILAKVDRATMAFGLEARSPFLDRALVELVLRMPRRWHFAGLRGKRMLRGAVRGAAPDFIWGRRKQGFASPMGHWLRGPLGADLTGMISTTTCPWLEKAPALAALAAHRDGQGDDSPTLWLLYTDLAWRDRA